MTTHNQNTAIDLSLIDFQRKFSSDDECQKKLFSLKWPGGFICNQCKSQDYTFIKTRNLYECKQCGRQHSATSGTIMHKTRIPLSKWFLAIFFMASDKRGISSLLLSKTLNISYRATWMMLHKIRTAMKERDSQYKLQYLVELDETFIGSSSEGNDKKGRGSDKIKVLIGVSIKDDAVLYAKIDVIQNASSSSLKEVVVKNIKEKQVVRTDGWKGYSFLSNLDYTHVAESISSSGLKAHEILKWVHVTASNLKAFIAGTFHGLRVKYIQKYADEFGYRFNRRRQRNICLNLIEHCVIASKITLTELKA